MVRKEDGLFEDIVIVASKLPWWAGITLALISYLVLHSFAVTLPAGMTGPGQMGTVVLNGILATLAMVGQFLVPFAFALGALISAINQFKQKRVYNNVAKRSGVASLNEMSWQDFERLMCEYYRRQGFQVTREGGNGPDGGIDLTLRKGGETYLVQCKQWKSYKVGVQPVREFYGVIASRGAAGGYFVTSSEYTNEARAFAKGLNLELVDGRKLREMIDTAQKQEPGHVAAVPNKAVRPTPAGDASQLPPMFPVSPLCPKCNAEMVIRTVRQGSKAGSKFWGCTAYPKCKGTRATEGNAVNDRPAVVSKSATAPPAPEMKDCPDCGTELVLRTFMSGPRNGEQFRACLPCKKGWPLGHST